ncbi:hypothetical protein ABL78_2711 [Leptomonas seymouri]|uniref:Uncharacterized protein n=1 Tax=Leptomonas seymouri TaxID=5684 RepID=A0A0N0P7D8_LEPSE|nr:hypothetical protein ABL78_2711 [Leptomonas seymouri]|eukprot:KPI88207.1 hypothetical protein ABL78_2711 [Leptomonas seymouri]
MDDHDGDISNVNPDLLKLCANADDWREQRRRAMKAKIFGGDGGGNALGGEQSNPNAYLPSEGTTGPSPPSAPSATAAGQIPPSQQASEAYILQQILSHKRRRDEANLQPVDPSIGAVAPPCSAQQAPHQHQRSQYHHQQYNQQQGYSDPPRHPSHQPLQQTQHPPPQSPQSEGELSLKEKLMRKYRQS